MPTSDADRDAQLLQNLAVRIGAIREAIEAAFGGRRPTAPTLNAEFEIIMSAIYAAADQRRPVPLTGEKPPIRAHWQHDGRLILQQASAAALTRQIHLALFMDGKLDTGAFEHMAALGDGSGGRDGGSAERKERGFMRHDQGEATDRHGC